MLKVERGFTVKMGLLLAASSAVRSNALLNLGFPLYRAMKAVARELAVHCRLKQGFWSFQISVQSKFIVLRNACFRGRHKWNPS